MFRSKFYSSFNQFWFKPEAKYSFIIKMFLQINCLFCFVTLLGLSSAVAGRGDVIDALGLDDRVFRNRSFHFSSRGTQLSRLGLEPEDIQKDGFSPITLLARVFLGSECSAEGIDGDEEAEQIKMFCQILLSFPTSLEMVTKIKKNEQAVELCKKYQRQESEARELVEFFKKRGEWGPIVTEELQETIREAFRTVSKKGNHFLLRHTTSLSPQGDHVNGTLILYPGHNLGILEDDALKRTHGPQWEAAHLQYEVFIKQQDTNARLHIIHIGVNSLWRQKGIGYALAKWFKEFCYEHFPQVGDLTVSCRNEISEKIFEKCGFAKTKDFSEASHHAFNKSNDEDGQKLIPQWHKSQESSYKKWLNKNHSKVFPDRFHKVGYKYFLWV